MSNQLRIVIAGAGRFGTLHARTWLEAGAVLVGVVDVDEARAAMLAEKYGARAFGGTLSELLERVSADVVVIASDEGTHSALADTAIEAGCHVFVEKPFALSGEAASRTIALAEMRGLVVFVGQISRFSQPFAYARNAIQSGRLGTIWSIRLRRDFSKSWLADFGARVHPVWESCIHDIDLAIFLASSQPLKVYAVASGQEDGPVPSSISALIEFANSTTATVESAWSIPDGGPQTLAGGALELSGTIAGEAEVIGSLGTLKQRLVSDALIEWGQSGVTVPDLSLWPEEHGRIGGALKAEVDYAISVFGGHTDNALMPHEEAHWGVQTAEAIIRSISSGRTEQVGSSQA